MLLKKHLAKYNWLGHVAVVLVILAMIVAQILIYQKQKQNQLDLVQAQNQIIKKIEKQMDEQKLIVTSEWSAISPQVEARIKEIISDDRCPIGVTCESSGVAEVLVEFRKIDNQESGSIMEQLVVSGLNRSPMPSGDIKQNLVTPLQVSLDNDLNFTVLPLDLQPYPDSPSFFDQSPELNQYQLLIKIQ
ncbi:MAG: hypothetical protein R3B41_03410 [Candidatus Doudnabacteria bacterium]